MIKKDINEDVIFSSRSQLGFKNPIMGKYLCPVKLDWDDIE